MPADWPRRRDFTRGEGERGVPALQDDSSRRHVCVNCVRSGSLSVEYNGGGGGGGRLETAAKGSRLLCVRIKCKVQWYQGTRSGLVT